MGWEGIGESTSDLVEKLTAKVENTTDKRIEATIFTLMLAPGASTRTEHLVGIYVLKPREAARLTINVADLPVQTSGVATALELSAKYVGSSGPVAPRTQTAISPPSTSTSYSSTLYLTYEDDFLTATVRSEHEESRINGENFRLGKLQALKGLKLDGVLVTEVALSDVHPQRIIMLPKDFFPPPSLQGDARK